MSTPYSVPDINRLEQLFLVSNTPMFLYKGFQRDNSVQQLSLKLSTREQIDGFEALYGKANKSGSEYVMLYAILIALTFKSDSDTKAFFKNIAHLDLRWAKNISAIYLSNIRIDNNYKLPNSYRTPPKNNVLLSSNASTQTVKLNQ